MAIVRILRSSGIISLLIIICLLAVSAEAKYNGGTGVPNDPYLIYTAEQLNAIGLSEQDWDKHFKLMADIDLSGYAGTDFNIIGYWVALDSPDNRPFRGVFDGNGHTISNFTYTCTGKDHIGLFGYIEDHDAEIKNLGLIDPNIDAGTESWGISSLAGYLIEGTITDCYVDGGSISGDEEVGGLLGCNWVGTIKNCYSTSIVSGNEDVGGLVGDNAGTITNCYSLGSVSGDEWVGGLVGWNWGTITNCYSTGHVEGTVDVGGLVGYGGGAIASFWDIETSGQPASAGGIGKTTAEMQTASTFVGWSFGDIWTINEGKDYPRLWWETEQGEEPEVQQLSDFLTGAGTEDNPYLIYTAEELNMIGLFPNDWDKHFKLMVDIDLAGITGTDFNIMGRGPDSAFSGVFDGNGRKILNFTYTSTEALNVGLFGYLKSTAVIKDLGLIDPNVYTGIFEMGGWGVGSLVGLVGDGTIISCYVEGGSVTGGWMVGLLIGYVEEGTVTNCYIEGGSVSGDEDIGGLVGFNQGTITNCYAIGTISCNNGGGLVGTHWAGDITNCYSAGSVTGNEWVGGLAGFNFGTITKCYSVCGVTANDIFGGLVGDNWGDIMYSFWDVETSGQLTSAGGVGLTTAEMQMASSFLEAGWDFVGETINGPNDVWKMWSAYDYPRLVWETGPNTPLVFVEINDPDFYGQMSKYEVTNAQYCDFLNAALASAEIMVDGNDVIGTTGSNSGEDYVGQRYYRCNGSGYTGYGAINAGASRIHYNEGTFSTDEGFGNHPVTYVSWYGAMAFCNYYGYYLPTEDQWQAVADYDGTYIYGCGETIKSDIVNYKNSEHPDGTTKVGSFGIYGYGMSDIAGNVWEWTSSILENNRVFRGGSMGSIESDCAISIRGEGIPHANYWDIGFRVCR